MAERSSLDRLQDEYDIELDWRGFELHPETPEGGVEIARLFGADRVEPMRQYMRRFAAQFGITDMRHPSHLPNTRRVLAAAEYARDRDRLDPFREAAMNAYWRDGEDLEDEAVVRRIAAGVGLEADPAVAAMSDPDFLGRVDAVRRESINAGVTGIPTFFIGDEVVVGCQPYGILAAAVERAGGQKRDDSGRQAS
ncbi:MAG: DsbA family protein [Gemmatimonadetes bacterium]|nr:DsbA family protein [Gemmatimonadota bacterium]